MAEATLTISSRNYSSWSLRGWLLCRMAGLDFATEVLSGDPASRAELLHLSPSFLVPRLTHGAVRVWDVLAIAAYLDEWRPQAGLLPEDRAARALCRAISGEMHGGFTNLRSALPMNLRARYADFKVWGGRSPTSPASRRSGRTPSARPRAVPVRRAADARRRDVRAGLHPLRHLRRRPAGAVRGLPRPRHGVGADAGLIAAVADEPEEIEELDMEF